MSSPFPSFTPSTILATLRCISCVVVYPFPFLQTLSLDRPYQAVFHLVLLYSPSLFPLTTSPYWLYFMYCCIPLPLPSNPFPLQTISNCISSCIVLFLSPSLKPLSFLTTWSCISSAIVEFSFPFPQTRSAIGLAGLCCIICVVIQRTFSAGKAPCWFNCYLRRGEARWRWRKAGGEAGGCVQNNSLRGYTVWRAAGSAFNYSD